MVRTIFFAIAVMVLATAGSPQMSAGARETGEWPCFHGPERTNKSAETGLLDKWSASGPDHIWTVTGLGDGYSTVSVADGYIYTAGKKDGRTCVYAYDMDGTLMWERPNGEAWATTMSHARAYTGARSTPTIGNGVVYHLGETGRLAAFDHDTGDEIWAVNIRETYDAQVPEYGYAESVLLDGDRLYCSPAGRKAFMVCLDARDGSLIWANDDITGVAGYCSPVRADCCGVRHVISMSSDCVYGVDAGTGTLLWSVPYEGQRSLNNTDPVVHNSHVFITSGYGKGSMLLKLTASVDGIVPETVWETELMDNHHGGVVFHEGFLYGAGHNERGWFCLDFMSGEEKWKSRGKGSLVYADGMIYLLEEKGTVKLVRATHEAYEEVSTFDVPRGGSGMHWAHPVVCGGRLYVRHNDTLYAYDIKAD